MTTKHTPGPWTVGPKPYYHCRIYASSENHAIARTYGPELNGIGVCSLTGPQNEADARLIAAAPDLLESLRGLYAAMACYEKTPEETLALDYASEAIAKATGGAA